MDLAIWQWVLGAVAALFVGISKTGIPGTGILVVPLLAFVFGGRPSVGVMLPMLIFADCFAVAWYKRHAQWDKIIRLLPWVVVGLIIGIWALKVTGESKSHVDVLGKVIGAIVLLMLALHLLRGCLGEKLTPRSKIGAASTGIMAGFTTMISNAAGPVMSIYFAAHNMPKKEFVGTSAWYFFIVNLSKLPVYIVLSQMNPDKPIITLESLYFVGCMCPIILAGVFIGKWILPRFSQRAFDSIVLILAGVAAAKLLFGDLIYYIITHWRG